MREWSKPNGQRERKESTAIAAKVRAFLKLAYSREAEPSEGPFVINFCQILILFNRFEEKK
jgi:hypothetical protein